MKPIVVPVNFSTCAANAARYAADLAVILKTDLHLIHVIQVPVSTAEIGMTEYLYQEMVDAANTSLQNLESELTKHTQGRIRIETSLDAGSLAVKVKDFCRALKPYAIVLGAAGPSLEKFLAGSPVASLLHNQEYPVLVVPENVRFQPFRRILLACDLSDINHGLPHSMPLLKELREHFGSRFDVLTVETPKVPGGGSALHSSEVRKELFSDIYPDIHFIHAHKVEEGILGYLSQHEADLVMVFPKKHGLFEFHTSQSRKFAKHSPIPVLSLHE